METRGSYVFVGSMVLIAIAAAFLTILFLTRADNDYDEYDVIFRERVSGLSVGAGVSFNGIQKGTVKSLTIDPDDGFVQVVCGGDSVPTPGSAQRPSDCKVVRFFDEAVG